MGLRDIPEPYRLPILERLARDGDACAMYELVYALPSGEGGAWTPDAKAWARRASRTFLAAKEASPRYGWGMSLELVDLPRARRSRLLRAARLRHPEAMRAFAWTFRDARLRRRGLERAARAGSANAAYELAMHVETLGGDLRVVRRWLGHAVVLSFRGDREAEALALVERAGPFLRRFLAQPDVWRARATAGDAEGLLLLGYARRFGRGSRSTPTAPCRHSRPRARGSLEAALVLALSFSHHWMIQEYEEAAAWAERAMVSGDPLALALAGDMAAMETAAQKRRAVGWLKRAAHAGQTRAAHRLACGYQYGGFVGKDVAAAERWARVAAEGGHEGGMSQLATLLEERERPTLRSRREATAWRRKAAACGTYDDWTNWGVRLHEGNGVRRDDREAVRWYRRAAALGCPSATSNLGRCYRRGHGVPKSARLAARWFRRAVEVLDNAQAATCLGTMHRDGELGRPDAEEAVRWYRRAAAMGDREGLRELGIAFHEGTGVAKDHDLAALLYRAATALSDGWSAYCLAQCYRDGEGVRRNRRSAVRWFRVAIERGVKDARRDLRRFEARGRARGIGRRRGARSR